MKHFDDYRAKYDCVAMERREGILELQLHTDGGPLIWNEIAHRELAHVFADVGADPENRVIVLTGTGDAFCVEIKGGDWDTSTPRGWDKIYWEGKRILENLLDVEVPMIAAVNGPARIHAELAVLCDIVLAADTAVFQDAAHFATSGAVPGDGVHIVWPHLLGPNRAKYFLLTGQELSAQEALALGVVNEVLPPAELLPRAHALAAQLATRSDLALRYTRVALNEQMKRMLRDGLGYGLALEGLSAVDGRRS